MPLDWNALRPPGAWAPESWQEKDHRGMPAYPDLDRLHRVKRELASLSPLARMGELHVLRTDLRAVYEGRGFVLHLGTADERFEDGSPARVRASLAVIDTLRNYAEFMLRAPIVPIAAMAGGYAHSADPSPEIAGGVRLIRHHGEMINDRAPNPWARTPDPSRMLWAYQAAQATMTVMRQARACVYTSREAVNLHFEEALTRGRADGRPFLASAGHLAWIEQSSVSPSSGAIELLRGVLNPVALRIGPTLPVEQLVDALRTLNPDREPGRILLVSSFGTDARGLEAYARAVLRADVPVIWLCDPGFLNRDPSGQPVMPALLAELEATAAVHATAGRSLQGLFLDLSPLSEVQGRGTLSFDRALQVCSHFARQPFPRRVGQ
jgi:3-deoxy-7-phosphoheptulonate synthase